MINLMPYDTKKEIRSARVNVILSRYIIVILLAFGFLVLLLAGSYIVLAQTKESAQRLIDANGNKTSAYSSTQSQITALNNTLSQSQSVLSQDISYSNTLMNIGQQMPEGTVIDSLSLNTASFNGTPITFKAYAKTTDAMTALKNRFQSSPTFQNVKVDPDTSSIDGYPIGMSITLSMTRAVAQ